MKKTFLLALVLCIGIALSAQNIPYIDKELVNTSVQETFVRPSHATNPFFNEDVIMASNQATDDFSEAIVGTSWYDLQSNTMLGNRLQVWDDGTMAAVWTMGFSATAFPNRGTGYNYYDGTSWGPQPTARIQDVRCGWPSIAAWGADGEISVAHNGVAGLEWSQRESKGTGEWVQTNFLGPAGIENDLTWPRMVTTGDNNEVIHLFVNTYVEYMGMGTALLYSRSEDGGETWDPHNIILDGMGPDDYFELGADDYVMAAQGNTAVLLVGGAWNDLFMMRTDDNGDTWDKTVIWEHPYPFYDWNSTITDTFFCVDNSANIALNPQDGKAHVVFGINRVMHTEVGNTYNLFPYVDGIGYWNEDMDPFSNDLDALAPPQYGYANSEMEEDVNYIGWMQDVDGDGEITLATNIMYYRQLGPSTMPTITINPYGEVIVIFSSTTETYVAADDYNYKHLWLRTNAGGGWGEFTHMTASINHIFDECIFPVLGKSTVNGYYYLYHTDITPGLAFSDDHAWQENNTYVAMDIWTSIEENANSNESIALSVNPNPVTDRAMVNIQLEEPSDIKLTIHSITGQIVKEEKRSGLNGGNVTIGLDVNDLPSGTYVCTVQAGNKIATEKLIKR